MLIALWAILGLLVGGTASSFASALADRQQFGDPTSGEAEAASPVELVGVLASGGNKLVIMSRRSLWPSFLTGRCHNCGAPVGLLAGGPSILPPRQLCDRCGSALREPWPLGEVVGAVSFSLLAWRFDLGWPLALYSAFAAALILISLIDLRDRLILDLLSYPAIAAALLVSLFTIGLPMALLGGIVVGGILLFFFLMAVVIYRRGDAFGLGDVKLGLLIGLVVGFGASLTAVIYGILVGGLVGVVVLVIRRDRKLAVPYGPSLAIGALITLVTSPAVWR
jgi:leader peptidase (prepilin peptidase) / N-methyltransferase